MRCGTVYPPQRAGECVFMALACVSVGGKVSGDKCGGGGYISHVAYDTTS